MSRLVHFKCYDIVTRFQLTRPFCPYQGSPGGSNGKESACNAGDVGLISGLGRSPGGGHGNPLQYSCLENPMDRGAWQATDQRAAKEWDMSE